MATAYLVRHGETPWTKSGRVQGWAPIGLSSTGVEQVKEVGETVAELVSGPPVIVSSDLQRATDTAEIIANRAGTGEFTTDRRLRERDFGVFQGLDDPLYHELRADMMGDKLTWAPENGESWTEVRSRTLEAWHGYTQTLPGTDPLVLVSHYGPIHCILSAVTGRALTEEFDIGHSKAGITEISIEDGTTELLNRDM